MIWQSFGLFLFINWNITTRLFVNSKNNSQFFVHPIININSSSVTPRNPRKRRWMNVNSDYFVLISLWVVLPILLWKVVPKTRIREAVATFLFFQMLTWVFSIALTNAGLLEGPVRFFRDATTINFTMEYLAFPTAAVLFQLYFPKNAKFFRRFVHYMLWVGVILTFMALIGTFTNIMNIKIDNLIRSFFNFTIELWICRRYVLWVLQQPSKKGPNTYEY